jgi:hypothetical protein
MKSGPRDSTRQDLTGSLAGDKVRIKTGSHAGERGILQIAADGTLAVNLDSGEVVSALGEELTNFSLAARRAWEVMPKRAGRPPSLRPRMQMVSLRVEIELWQRLKEAVQDGLLPSGEQAINSWIRQHLDEIAQGSRASSTTVQAASDRDPLRGKQT